MNEWIEQFQLILVKSGANISFTLTCLAIIWCVFFLNRLLQNRLNYLGIYPRHVIGLPGMFFSPFLHDNFTHLFFNSLPLFILIELVLLHGYPAFYIVSLIIIIVGGGLVWLFGRNAIHIGASGLIMGYWGYLLFNVYYEHSIMAFILGILCLYYLGNLLFNLFPTDIKTSWEGHLFGFLAGILSAYATPNLLLYFNV